MIINKLNRKFKPSKETGIIITEKAQIHLKHNEQITLIDKNSNQYDIVKND